MCVNVGVAREGMGSITNRTRPRLGIDGLSGADLFLGAAKRTLSRAGRATAGEKQSCQSKPAQQQYTPMTSCWCAKQNTRLMFHSTDDQI